METAAEIGLRLGLDPTVRRDLREHRRPPGFMPESQFFRNVRTLFENPSEVVFGSESADQVADRIEREVQRSLSAEPNGNVLLVTHGTAMTCRFRRHMAGSAFDMWKSLALPAYVAFGTPRFGIVGSSGVDHGLFTELHTCPNCC